VVHKGNNPGIYSSWPECKKQIEGYEGAIFKKFVNQEEAQEFLKVGFGKNKVPKIVTRRKNDDEKNSALIEKETQNFKDGEDTGSNCLFIYTDGSLIKSAHKLPRAGYGIYIPSKNIRVSKPLINQKITNNRAELTAIIESVSHLNEQELGMKICIFTDSQYSMYIFNGTGERYEKNDYKNEGKDVPNIDLIKKILEIKRAYNIVLLKVRAHTDKKDKHTMGNEIADKLATDGALGKNKNEGDYDDNEDKDLKSYLTTMGKIGKFGKSDSNYKISHDEEINPAIQINDLFEFSELKQENSVKKVISTKNKNTKLTQWFIKDLSK
jgi:ribonuclease HI